MDIIWVFFLPIFLCYLSFTSDNTKIILHGIATHNPERIKVFSAFGRDFHCPRVRYDRKLVT